MHEDDCVKEDCGHGYGSHQVTEDIGKYEPCLVEGCTCWDFFPPPMALECGCLLVPAYVEGEREMQIHPCRMGCANIAAILQFADETGREVVIGER
jgi:hypothetical protein